MRSLALVLSFEQELEGQIRRELGEVQRDHIIREQIRLLQQELGEDEDTELTEYRMKIDTLKLTEEVRAKLLKEVDRLAKRGDLLPQPGGQGGVLREVAAGLAQQGLQLELGDPGPALPQGLHVALEVGLSLFQGPGRGRASGG